MARELRLERPSRALLPGFVAALKAGWSPSTSRDTSGEHLESIERLGGDAFLAGLNTFDGTTRLDDGRIVPKLPGLLQWMSDGDFAGSINFRYVPGTDELPAHCSGHIGYSVIPEKRRRGYGTTALGLILPYAREVGLARVSLTADIANIASRRVMEGQGGVHESDIPADGEHGPKALYWIAL